MGKPNRFLEMMGMILAIGTLFYLPLDWLQPYVLPVTLIGVVAILGIAAVVMKKRGLFILLLAVFVSAFSLPIRAEIVDCGGGYEQGQGIIDQVQDSMGGNVIRSDFKDKDVLACVQKNIAGLKGRVCGAPIDEDKYDAAVRADCFYVMDNFRRMSFGESKGDIDSAYDCCVKYVDNAAMVDRANEADCRTVGQTIQKGAQDCWICGLTKLVIDSVQLMAGNVYGAMQDAAFKLLAIVFLFWIAFKVLIFIGKMGFADNSEFFTEMLMRLITVMIAAALLHAPIVDFYRMGISPFITMSATLAGQLSDMAMTDGNKTFAEIVEQKLNINTDSTCQYCQDMNDKDFSFKYKPGTVEVLDAQSVNGILCMTCRAYRQVMPFIGIGESFNCYANAKAYHIPLTDIYIPNFMYLVVGYLIVIAFSLLAALIGLYMIDITLKLGFVIVLTPLFIAAWAFPISREYSTKAWHMILYCLLQFIGVAVMMALFLNLCLQIIPGDPTLLMTYMADNDIPGMFGVVSGMEPLSAGGSLAASGVVAGALVASGGTVALVAGGAVSFLLLIMLGAFVLFAIKMLTATDKVVENLSGIALGIPSIALGTLAGAVKEAASMIGVAVKVGGDVSKKAGKKVGDKMDKHEKKAKEREKYKEKEKEKDKDKDQDQDKDKDQDQDQDKDQDKDKDKDQDQDKDKDKDQDKDQDKDKDKDKDQDKDKDKDQDQDKDKDKDKDQDQDQDKDTKGKSRGKNKGVQGGKSLMRSGVNMTQKGGALGILGLGVIVAGAAVAGVSKAAEVTGKAAMKAGKVAGKGTYKMGSGAFNSISRGLKHFKSKYRKNRKPREKY